MPEGNEVHRHRERQFALFGGKILHVEAPNGRFSDGAKQLNLRKLRAIEAYGKHLFYDFGKDRNLHVHLGLYGKFRDGAMPYPEMRGALRLRIWTAEHWLELRGPTACDVLTLAKSQQIIDRIGPDPLRADANPAIAFERIAKSRSPIGALLMDQSVIGGLGNIYRAELLYRAKIHPLRTGNSVPERSLKSIWKDAAALMSAGMIDRRIVTTRPKDRPHKTGLARRNETHYVYRRKGLPCLVCGTEVSMRIFVGRKLYWCPICQPADTAPPAA